MQGIKYSVDIVMCMDSTGSMGGIIDKVKSNVLRFHEDLARVMEEKEKVIDTLRVRGIAFRDYYHDDHDSAMHESPFFTLPEEKERLAAFIQTCRADGGGDEPESGLEALALAMKSDWSKSGDRRRQIIVVWTDASAHPLEKKADSKPSNYPVGMPATFSELTDLWEGQHPMNSSAKRLIVYAPDAQPWTDISNYWENTVHYPSKAGEGCGEVDYSAILDAIANSV